MEDEVVNQELLTKYDDDHHKSRNELSLICDLPAECPQSRSSSPPPPPTSTTGENENDRIKISIQSPSYASSHSNRGHHNGFPKNLVCYDQLSQPSKHLLKQRPIPSSVKSRKRIVLKNGSINLCKEHIKKRSRRYLQDTFTTMVDLRWRYNLLVFTLGFVMSWLFFATIWYFVAFTHGDLGPDNEVKHQRCVIGVNSFTTAFLFSFESQHTIGFGNRYPHEDCIEGIIAMCLQSIFGVMVECFVVGFVFAKLSRPNKRSQTLIFSRHAVVNYRDGKLCLVVRVGDVRNRSYIIGASISALYITKKTSLEGEDIPYYHRKMKVRFDDCGTDLFLVYPITIIHEIDDTSPFYRMNADRIANCKFEIVIMLRGTVESTGQAIEARTSYLPHEIRWGKRFQNLVDYRLDHGVFRVDYSKFDSILDVAILNISAFECDLLRLQHAVEAEKSKQDNSDQYSDSEDHNKNSVQSRLLE